MAVIWGLDLKEMQWWKFKASYMFNRVYHLRCTKMIVYQIAMILCVISESVGTAALSDYVDQQDGIQRRSNGLAHVHNDDYVGIASYNIFVGIAVATIFGSGFFFDLFWPERTESKSVRLAWKISSLTVSLMALADAIAMTVIVATRKTYITGVSPEYANLLFVQNGPPPVLYRKNSECVASVVILWPGVVASFASTYIMWRSHFHDDQFGPLAARYRSKASDELTDLPSYSSKPVGEQESAARVDSSSSRDPYLPSWTSKPLGEGEVAVPVDSSSSRDTYSPTGPASPYSSSSRDPYSYWTGTPVGEADIAVPVDGSSGRNSPYYPPYYTRKPVGEDETTVPVDSSSSRGPYYEV